MQPKGWGMCDLVEGCDAEAALIRDRRRDRRAKEKKKGIVERAGEPAVPDNPS